ncbi:MAG: hypothetical protein IPO23_07565 [Flavobacterium sp.]|nr:hypothetical protein [Flavobacterium sp.]
MIYCFILIASLSSLAQNRVFTYSQIQTRNDDQEWSAIKNVSEQSVSFTCDEINLKVDKNYHLNIISKTDLPNNGVIYLCKDEETNPVTVMLIDDSKMYLYSKSKRYLINFDDSKTVSFLSESE